ncbi:PhzF family phenazine biosynthesis protein [Nevskia sp.]|uniref:PhzF family phenazine biosynthesis protein n=1 Tax=Nevskia sp. TaxID=1929292 RepID=UPI0025CCFBA2|nr:PhzF family phenazine biosynthesis protein [Nevskia sp.]
MSSHLQFHTLDVFTEQRYGGNPLAVVLAADGLNTRQMQTIAREFNLSETVFVLKPTAPCADFKLRIFTPQIEMPFAGHPTVGTACLLAELGLAPQGDDVRFVLEENVGLVPVRVCREAGRAPYGELTTAVLPRRGPDAPSAAALATMLGLEEQDIGYAGETAALISCGVPYVLIPLRSPELMAGISFDVACWRQHLAGGWAHQVYVYARGYEGELRARMFAPGAGVHEDPATGSAAVALAGRLALDSAEADGRLAWTIHQGLEMNRPSVLQIEADKQAGAVIAVRVGGHAVTVLSGTLPL